MEGNYNLRNPAVKRLMREAQELKNPTEQFSAHPLDDNLFEWHFTIRGPADSDFADGFYHGRIILPPEYPMKPPSIILLTASGRFETNKKICLSISGYHPETWLPSWSLRTALLGIIGFMPSHGGGAIGSLEYTPEERKALAKKSQEWCCPQCGCIKQHILPVTNLSHQLNKEAKEIGQQINLTGEKSKAEAEKPSPSPQKEEENPTKVVVTLSDTPAVTTAANAQTAGATAAAVVTSSTAQAITTAYTAEAKPATTTAANPATTAAAFHPASMTYQLPPYNLAQAYPFAFPQFPPFPTPSQLPQQTRLPNANILPPQFMWPYQQSFIPSSHNQPFPFFTPPFPTFPRMNTPFSNQSFSSFSSISTTTPLTVITSLSSTTLSHTTSTPSGISTTSTTSFSSTHPPAPSSAKESSTAASTLLSQSTTPTSTPILPHAQQASCKSPTSQLSEKLSSVSLSEAAAPSSSPSSTPSFSGNELRHRFIPSSITASSTTTFSPSTTSIATSTTTLSSITITSTITSISTSNNPCTTSLPTSPRIVRTNTSAEPSHRPNYHTGSGLVDALIDLCVIFILFCIFGLLSRRVFLNL